MTEIAGKAVELGGIVKRFGAVTAVHRMDLSIEEGSFVTLLGPSGCGKTTTLRMIAGLLDPSEGDITIKGKSVTRTPIHKRNLGIVFQNYALFPHKTIYDNVAFGLKYRKQSQSEIDAKVRQALDLVQLPDLSHRYPRELSGGQQQRIALARAIVIEPDVLLLDEPLSALDANLREDMRVELKRIQAQVGITTIFVTHDQSEALAMSDRIVVMSKGHIEQIGAPEDVYVNPASAFVARFLGNSNLVAGDIVSRSASDVNVTIGGLGGLKVPLGRSRDMADGERAMVVVRAERLYLDQSEAETPADAVSLPAEITAVDYQGQAARYFVSVCGHQMQAINPIETHPYRQGDKVRAVIRGRDCALVPFEASA
ncbi:ABC transporter ATP-binding protein [Pararhizobium antarcticum]|uniref:ABC transporter ATP-binding protein n=1 Tax=Pararhizobium antarcticum TaxID=1798805 RepID=A0A657LZK5_9HYPH|nr:ABC transporter ATP-binding protein [Pararhizobium antarcticum]OJF91651.1 ABC transporter ATP-binding protein [Rhizobium sp. 58]OJF99214.1 ABC transporter ATP-binding protein [Pararhizobium antarcticum]